MIDKPDTPQYDGVETKIGKQKMVVPPLGFKQLRECEPEIIAIEVALQAAIAQRKSPLVIMLRQLPIILAALQRNYPNYTLDELEKELDVRQIREVYRAVMGISDVDLKAAVEAGGIAAPGKATASA